MPHEWELTLDSACYVVRVASPIQRPNGNQLILSTFPTENLVIVLPLEES